MVGVGKQRTYLSPKPTFCPKWEVSVNVGLGEGKVGSFPETYNDSVSFQVDEGPNMEGATHCFSINQVLHFTGGVHKSVFWWPAEFVNMVNSIEEE